MNFHKKLIVSNLTAFILIILRAQILFAQGSICGATVPVPICPMDTILCPSEFSDEILLSINSSLPDLEFAIIDLNQQATNNSGPAIIGIDMDGRFIPSDFGVDSNTTLAVFPVAYDLQAIQETLDDILKGTIPPFNIPCCTLNAAFCTQLTGAGINCGSDFTSLSQAFSLFSSDTSELFSLQDLLDDIDSLNMTLSSPLIPAACGGGDMICYAYGSSCHFLVEPLAPLLVIVPPYHMMDTSVVAQVIQSSAFIPSGVVVQYTHAEEAILLSGFEIELNGILESSSGGCE